MIAARRSLAVAAAALTAASGVVAIAGDADARKAGRRKGKVVRVERGHTTRLTPLACSMYYGSGACYGREIPVGTVATVVDEKGARAVVRVKDVTPQNDRCGNATGWSFNVDTVSGDVQAAGQMWLVIDLPLDRLRSMAGGTYQVPPGQAENAWAGFDVGSDGVADYIVTWHNCTEGGAPQQSGDPSFCMNYYEYRSGQYTRIHQDFVRSCG